VGATAPAQIASSAAVDARDPAAREPLLGLAPYRRVLLAAHEAGRSPLGLIASPEDAPALLAECESDPRLRGAQIEIVGPDDPRPRLDGACVLDASSAGDLLEGRTPGGMFAPADAAAALKRRTLLRGLANPADGLVDTWLNRRLSRFMTRWLVGTGISPNAVTVISCLLGLLGAAGIASRDPRLGIAGALVFQLAAAVDCVDGEIARLTHRSSPFGAKLDIALDNVVHIALFAAMAWAAVPLLGAMGALAWGAGAVLGGLLSFAVVYWLSFGEPQRPSSKLKRVLDRFTNRDFSLGVIAVAFVGRWDVLLMIIAVGSNLFWLVLLGTQRRLRGE
jgi:phosphatidylglycerophosphate synthase